MKLPRWIFGAYSTTATLIVLALCGTASGRSSSPDAEPDGEEAFEVLDIAPLRSLNPHTEEFVLSIGRQRRAWFDRGPVVLRLRNLSTGEVALYVAVADRAEIGDVVVISSTWEIVRKEFLEDADGEPQSTTIWLTEEALLVRRE